MAKHRGDGERAWGRTPTFLVYSRFACCSRRRRRPSGSRSASRSTVAVALGRSPIMAAEAEEPPQETPQEEVGEEESPAESGEGKEEAPAEEKEEAPAEEKKEAPAEEEEEAPAAEEEEAPAEEEEEEEEEELVDPKVEIEESCKPKCVKQLLVLQACEKRVEEDEKGHKHCTGQYFDYWGCIDKCTAPKLFRKLK